MKSIIAIALLSFGCHGDAHADTTAPADGVARAAVASLPASEWPCAVREKSREGGKMLTREIEYARTSCVVPASILHYTLGGCPTRIKGGRVTYDAQGRLVQHGDDKYDWGKNGPIAHDGKWMYVALGDDVAMRDGATVDEIVRIDAQGRVTSIDQMRDVLDKKVRTKPLYSFRIEYSGKRIVRTQYAADGYTPAAPIEVIYSCPAKP